MPGPLSSSEVAGSTFGDQHMDMWVPFQIADEGMQGDNHAWLEALLMVLVVEPVREYLGSGLEKDMEEGAVLMEVGTQFFGDGEDDMAVPAVDELEGDGIGTVSLIGSATGIAESEMAAERDELVCAAVRVYVKGAAEIRVTAVDGLSDFRLALQVSKQARSSCA